jgi:hypothetical protein
MTGNPGAAWYEIRVDGVLDGSWAAWFDGLKVSGEGAQTVLSGLIPDQPALHGLLAKIRDLGLCLTSVRRDTPPEGKPS